MKKIFLLVLLFITFKISYAQFPSTDSLRAFDNKWITNSPTSAFTNLRLNTLLYGMINWIDTARLGAGSTIGIDTLFSFNDSTLKYRKNGSFFTFTQKGIYDSRKKVDTLFSLNDSTLSFTINGVTRNTIIRGVGHSAGDTTAVWGLITGDYHNQTDLLSALNNKQNLIPTGTSSQYFRGDFSLATFPNLLSVFAYTNGNGLNGTVSVVDSLTSLSIAPAFTGLTSSNGSAFLATTIGNGLLYSGLTLKADTSILSTQYDVGLKLSKSDTSTMLAHYTLGSGTTNQVAYFKGTRLIGGDANYIYDPSNKSLFVGNNSYTNAVNAFALGQADSSFARWSFTIGLGNSANGEGAFAGGLGSSVNTNHANGDASFSFGESNLTQGQGSVAMGIGNVATSESSISMGESNSSEDLGAVSFGSGNHSLGATSISLGNQNIASGTGSIAMGGQNNSSGDYSNLLGSNLISHKNYLTVFGRFNDSTETIPAFEVGWGVDNTHRKNLFVVDSIGRVKGGLSNTVSGLQAASFGKLNISSGNYSFTSGLSDTASNEASVAMGEKNNVSGFAAVAIGDQNVVSGPGSMVLGFFNSSSGNENFVIGVDDTATAAGDVIFGGINKITGSGSFAGGTHVLITGAESFAYGAADTVLGDNSVTFGPLNTTRNFQNFIYGGSNIANKDYQIVFGRYNDTTQTIPAFQVGWGYNATHRKNIFSIDTLGDVLATTVSTGDSSNFLATTAWVKRQSYIPGSTSSGTYTPVISNASVNITSSTFFQAQWTRIGNMVTIYGQFSITSNTTSNVGFNMSLPSGLSTNFSTAFDLSGSFANAAISGSGGAIVGDASNDIPFLVFQPPNTSSNQYTYSYRYLIE